MMCGQLADKNSSAGGVEFVVAGSAVRPDPRRLPASNDLKRLCGCGYKILMASSTNEAGWTIPSCMPWLAAVALFGRMLCPAFAQAPANDNFSDAISLYGDSATITGNVMNATYEPGEAMVVRWRGPFAGGSVWWTWTPTNSGVVVVAADALQSGPETGFALYAATNFADVANNSELDWNYLDFITNRYLCAPITSGTKYYLRAFGGTTVPFTLHLMAASAPVLLAVPQDQTIPESCSAFFSVLAAGLRPLSYQWQYEGKNLQGETAPCLELHYVAASRAGEYSVVVSNVSGVVTSAVAQLTISPPATDVVLKPLDSPDAARFRFSITGEAGRKYRVWASTNLVQWFDEEEFRVYPWDVWSQSVVQNTNATSIYSIPKTPAQKFLRIARYMDTEICIAHLREIDFAIKLWAVENRKDKITAVTETDIVPYLKETGVYVCPSRGTTFADSYSVTQVANRPTCQKNYLLHTLP